VSDTPTDGVVLVVGSEPAALSCCLGLLECGIPVRHAYPAPVGLHGSSRDIGLAYPELGEPWERIAYALGEDIALEFYQWSKAGVEDLSRRLPDLVMRGSRLALTRTTQETKLVSTDAMERSKPPVEDQMRLMSGVAVSNYAPVHSAELGSFETHAAAFAPVTVLKALLAQLDGHAHYTGLPLASEGDWNECRLSWAGEGVELLGAQGEITLGDVAVVGAGLDTCRLVGRLRDVLVPVHGQAFRSQPLPESTRSSVVGLTASWGYERYRFDSERRLLGCGVDPTGSHLGHEAVVDEKVMRAVLQRAGQMFVDFDSAKEDELMRWAVRFDGTCDGLPVLGPLPGESKIQVVCGFGLSAWSRGWEAGRQMSRAVSSQNVGGLIERCSARRFLRV
jgi:glycine/D-amino acid oxidase-like deaminating enzyme